MLSFFKAPAQFQPDAGKRGARPPLPEAKVGLQTLPSSSRASMSDAEQGMLSRPQGWCLLLSFAPALGSMCCMLVQSKLNFSSYL